MHRLKRLTVVLVALLGVGMGMLAAPISSAHAGVGAVPENWNCTLECDGDNLHHWDANSVWGLSSYVYVHSPNCTPLNQCLSTNGGISLQDVLADSTTTHYYYILAGYIYPGLDTHIAFSYFWQQWRPQDSDFTYTFLAYVPTADYNTPTLMLIQNSDPGHTTYSISVVSKTFGTLGDLSTGNAMAPDLTTLLIVLAGAKPPLTESAPLTAWEDNDAENAGGIFHYYSSSYGGNGSTEEAAPPDAEWAIPPTSSSTGGTFHTSCIC